MSEPASKIRQCSIEEGATVLDGSLLLPSFLTILIATAIPSCTALSRTELSSEAVVLNSRRSRTVPNFPTVSLSPASNSLSSMSSELVLRITSISLSNKHTFGVSFLNKYGVSLSKDHYYQLRRSLLCVQEVYIST